MNATKKDAIEAIKILREFVPGAEFRAIADGCRSEEMQFFFDKVVEMVNIINTMPVTYGQDGKGDQAIAYLHYFRGNQDWYITEKDAGTNRTQEDYETWKKAKAEIGEPFDLTFEEFQQMEKDLSDGQIQAFGLADLGYGAELGYISIVELVAAGVELDLHFTPKTLAEIKAEAN